MRKAHCLVSALIAVLIISLPGHTATLNWAKYVSQDGSFSFHHPQGWQVTESESGLVVQGGSSSEQLWLVPLPYQDSWSAQQHANFFLSILQKENPELEASGWQSDPGGEAVLFDLIYRSEQQQLQGIGLVTKDSGSEQALWFHHLAPEEGYVRARGESILEGFVNSLAPGPQSLLLRHWPYPRTMMIEHSELPKTQMPSYLSWSFPWDLHLLYLRKI